jgi:hypothetical protein
MGGMKRSLLLGGYLGYVLGSTAVEIARTAPRHHHGASLDRTRIGSIATIGSSFFAGIAMRPVSVCYHVGFLPGSQSLDAKMTSDAIQFDNLLDVDAYSRSGRCPWTFFAFPTAMADDHGLPPDKEACGLLAHLQRLGLEVGVWVNGIRNGTNYFACRKEDMHILHEALQHLESQGIIERDFCRIHTERLYAQIATEAEPSKPPASANGAKSEFQ